MPSSVNWTFKRALQKILPQFLLVARNRKAPRFNEDPTFHPLSATPTLSNRARRMLAKPDIYFLNMAENRKANALSWRYYFDQQKDVGKPLFNNVEEGPAPYRYVQEFQNGNEAAQRYDYFRSLGVPVESWPDLPSEIKADPNSHSFALRLRKTLLFFPVHKSMEYLRKPFMPPCKNST